MDELLRSCKSRSAWTSRAGCAKSPYAGSEMRNLVRFIEMRSMVQNFRFLIRIARKLQIIESRNCLKVKGNFLFSSFALSFTASCEKSTYLASSLVNLVDLCVPHQFLHRILAIEARSAEDLNVSIIAANESISNLNSVGGSLIGLVCSEALRNRCIVRTGSE